MNIQYVSLTGADNLINIKDLKILSEEFSKAEWAILMFPEREGKARNPTKEWREAFYKEQLSQTALHLCGSAIEKFAVEDIYLLKEVMNFQRVQINLKPQWASEKLVEQLVKVVSKHSHIEFITQYNEVNQEYFKYWEEVKNHNYLFDASLGKGLTPEVWSAPKGNKIFGYAGGLNPENLNENLAKIKEVTQNKTIWIDMETGLRTNDNFDLEKVKKVLTIEKQFNKVIEYNDFKV